MMNSGILEEIDSLLSKILSEHKSKYTPELFNAMEYSLFSSGKRVRPYLMCLSADFLQIDRKIILPLALAVELIHTYSLIHDDLPCMDNDDFRRGKPSLHKVYGEAMALLAGDALLNLAYETMLNACKINPDLTAVAAFIAECAGADGMIGGQAMEFSEIELDETRITELCIKKTGALIKAATLAPAYLGCDADKFAALGTYANAIGLNFQLCDDLLDEKKNEVKSYLNIMGKEYTFKMSRRLNDVAKKSLSKWKEGKELIDFSEFLTIRKK